MRQPLDFHVRGACNCRTVKPRDNPGRKDSCLPCVMGRSIVSDRNGAKTLLPSTDHLQNQSRTTIIDSDLNIPWWEEGAMLVCSFTIVRNAFRSHIQRIIQVPPYTSHNLASPSNETLSSAKH